LFVGYTQAAWNRDPPVAKFPLGGDSRAGWPGAPLRSGDRVKRCLSEGPAPEAFWGRL